MKTIQAKQVIITQIAIFALIITQSVKAESAFTDNLNPLEKNTVTIFQKVSENGQVSSAVAKTKNLEKDITYLNSHTQESVLAKNSEANKEVIYNSLEKQLLKSFVGKYEDEIRNRWLTIDFSSDEKAEPTHEVVSYDRENFELTMSSRKNKLSSPATAAVEGERKGRWKLKPKLSTPGAALTFDSSNIYMEVKVTTEEKVVNVQRNLKQLALSTSYNIDLNDNKSKFVVNKPLPVKGLSLQMEKIGSGVSAFSGSEQRVSLNFGQAF